MGWSYWIGKSVRYLIAIKSIELFVVFSILNLWSVS